MRATYLTGCVLLALAGTAAAQDPGPVAGEATTNLKDATVVARGTTIRITRLPIHTAAGTIYRDVTIELHVDQQGRVTLATDSAGRAMAAGVPAGAAPERGAGGPVSPASGPARVALQSVPSGQAAPGAGAIELPQQPSPPIVYQTFTPGTYTAADGSLIQVESRGMDLIHHVPAWSLSSPTGAAITSAVWWSGPPFLSPRSNRLRRAQITGTDYAYGVSDEGSGGVFGTGALIGVKQVGRTLEIVSFHHGCCTDEEQPVAMLSFTRIGG